MNTRATRRRIRPASDRARTPYGRRSERRPPPPTTWTVCTLTDVCRPLRAQPRRSLALRAFSLSLSLSLSRVQVRRPDVRGRGAHRQQPVARGAPGGPPDLARRADWLPALCGRGLDAHDRQTGGHLFLSGHGIGLARKRHGRRRGPPRHGSRRQPRPRPPIRAPRSLRRSLRHGPRLCVLELVRLALLDAHSTLTRRSHAPTLRSPGVDPAKWRALEAAADEYISHAGDTYHRIANALSN